MDLITFFKNNFWHVAPNLALGAIAFAIILERLKTLFFDFAPKDLGRFMNQIAIQINKANLKDAVQMCDSERSSLAAQVVKEGLIRSHLPESAIQDGLALGLARVSRDIQKRISSLSVIANVATLIGLVGTIVGLIASFEALAFADAQQKSSLLAHGISTSMNATLLGLAIAICCLLAYSVLSNQANKILSELEQCSMMCLDWLRHRAYSIDDQGK